MALTFTTFAEVSWATPSAFPPLACDEVHVWLLPLDQYLAHFEWSLQRLSTEELERVSRYHFRRDRERFAIARAMKKSILGGYLNVPAKEVDFRYNSYGKPSLVDPGPNDLKFNLSHSNNLALLAVTRGRELGADLEYQRPEVATEDIARRYFSRAEVESLAKLPKELQVEGFFKCWTRKEAYIKGLGMGLSFALDRFTVPLGHLHTPEFLEVSGDSNEVARWMVWDVSPNSDYAGAVVAHGSNMQLRPLVAVGSVPSP